MKQTTITVTRKKAVFTIPNDRGMKWKYDTKSTTILLLSKHIEETILAFLDDLETKYNSYQFDLTLSDLREYEQQKAGQ